MKDNKEKSFAYYTDGVKTIKVKFGETPPSGFHKGRTFKSNPWNKGLTSETSDKVKSNTDAAHKTRIENGNYVAWNKGLTMDDERVALNIHNMQVTIKDKYGVENISQYLSTQEDYSIWNKGLTKENDDRMRKASDNHKGCVAWNRGISIQGHPQTKEAREKISQSHLSQEVKCKRYESMRENGTLCVHDSKAEKDYYQHLCEQYGEENVIRQYFDKERYPFKCDFYVAIEDLFIEIHANWTHGKMPFDQNNKECQEKLALWQEKAKTSKYYENAIYTWTNLDVRKAQIAKENNLNYIVIY